MKVHEFDSWLVHDKPFAPAEIDKLIFPLGFSIISLSFSLETCCALHS